MQKLINYSTDFSRNREVSNPLESSFSVAKFTLVQIRCRIEVFRMGEDCESRDGQGKQHRRDCPEGKRKYRFRFPGPRLRDPRKKIVANRMNRGQRDIHRPGE